MKRYGNLSGDSPISEYEAGPGYIAVRFGSVKTYWYTRVRPGAAHVVEMTRLAEEGRGLATYIASCPAVRHGYERIT